jgi:nucleotide-binding universal stress UspA family protein
MTYRDILINVPSLGDNHEVRAGLALAKTFGAHATGISSLPEVATLRDALKNPFLQFKRDEVEARIAEEYKRIAVLEREFAAAARRAGVTSSWLAGEGDVADLIVKACRLHDLVVASQGGEATELLWGPAVQLALSGHPVYIVPSGWQGDVIPRRAVVAWNESAESAAAIRNAMPLLERCEQVTLLQGPSRETFPFGLRVPRNDVLAYLRRHDVKVARPDGEIADVDAGPAILTVARETDAGLIVMGAFGRSRFSEWVLGGATRHVLEHMKAPVFMVH